MLLRLAYLGVTNAFAMLCLLPMSDHGKDVVILALGRGCTCSPHRARQPPDQDPGRDRASDRLLGGTGREEPRHGP